MLYLPSSQLFLSLSLSLSLCLCCLFKLTFPAWSIFLITSSWDIYIPTKKKIPKGIFAED